MSNFHIQRLNVFNWPFLAKPLLSAAAIWINKQTYALVPPHTAYSSELNFTHHCLHRQFRQADANGREWRDNAFIYRLFGRREDLSDCVRACVRGVSVCLFVCMDVPVHLYTTETHCKAAREMWFRPEETQKEQAKEEARDNRHIQRNCVLSQASGVCAGAPRNASEADVTCSTETQTPVRECWQIKNDWDEVTNTSGEVQLNKNTVLVKLCLH